MKVLPDVNTIAADLRKMSLADAARLYGTTASAICVKLRRAGQPRGKSVNKRPHMAKIKPIAISEAAGEPDGDFIILTVTRTTSTGVTGTLPRVTFIDGPAEREAAR